MSEADKREFRIRRGILKSQLTRFKKFIEQISSEQLVQLPERLEKCRDIWKEFDEVQGKLENLDENEFCERELFEDIYFEVVSIGKGLIEKQSSSSNSINQNISVSNVSQDSTPSYNNVKLPIIELPKFHGNYSEWITFYDTFRSLIHSNDSLNNIQRLYYLKSCLKGDAAEVLRSLEVSETNYAIAWDLLSDRYENKRLIVHNHIKALFDLQSINKESAFQLRKLHDDVKKNLRALKVLGQPTDQWDALLIYMISSKLDGVSKREWEKSIMTNELPTMENLFEFLSQRCQLLEALQPNQQGVLNKSASSPNEHVNKLRVNKGSNTRSFVISNGSLACYLCKESHPLYSCSKFLELPVKARINEVKKLKLCFNCLRSSHSVSECISRGCKHCKKKHNSLLHFNEFQQTTVSDNQPTVSMSLHSEDNQPIDMNQPDNAVNSKTTSLHCHVQMFSEVLLSTALVYIADRDGQLHECRVLLDSASQSNLISSSLCERLRLKRYKVNIPVIGINQHTTNSSYVTETSIKSRLNNFKVKISFIMIDKITGNLPIAKIDKGTLNIPDNIILADSTFNVPGEVDALLGASIFWDLLCIGQIQLNKGQPIMQKTMLGWIISGSIPRSNVCSEKHNKLQVSCNVSTITIQEQLEKFWNVEECVNKQSEISQEEQECEEYYRSTTTREVGGHFVVKLPTKDNIEEIGDSYTSAMHRFRLLEKKFARNQVFKQKYGDFIREYEELGHMSLVCKSEQQEGILYYLPHHGVYKESSETTKLRVVFDASAKSDTGISLNDKLKVGPRLQDDLLSILLRFRRHNYVITADVEKMYRMVFVHEDQRDLQRILWRPHQDEDVQEYRLNTLTYGTASAAYLAIRSLQQVGHENQEHYPNVCQAILKDFYVDDLLTGAKTFQEAKQLREDLMQVLSSYGFNLRKWMSNDRNILDGLVDLDQTVTHLVVEGNMAKILGLTWNSVTDSLHYSIDTTKCNFKRVTKRTILSTIAQVFDPLGLVGPCVIKAKLIMQQLWKLKIQWDETVPLELHSTWMQFCNRLQDINKLSIPRHVFCSNPTCVQLQCFCDASELAYGACVYVRTTNSVNDHLTFLLCAKSKVAPVKKLTIPKLELCGALLLSKLVNKVIEALSIKFDKILYYTDSSIVLAWILMEPYQLKTFVSNRVAEIQRLTNVSSWRHVSSKENPADVLSRGISAEQLASLNLWWKGPVWLEQNEECWPEQTINQIINDLPERNSSQTFYMSIQRNVLFEKYSTLTRLQRIVAYCIRFKTNSQLKKECRISGTLKVHELDNALKILIKLAQMEDFASEIKYIQRGNSVDSCSKILSLNPFLDKDGILRVGGRLQKSKFPYDNKHQIILPSGHKLTKLIVLHEHRKQLHLGPQSLLASIRQRFWPISGRNIVRNVFRHCVICFRARPTTYEHIMGNLPEARITPSRPFNISGVDYAGPFDIKASKLRGCKILKSYMCIFVCFVTKAVHIELVSDLSTDCFLNCLKRFIARRGKCSHIYSDNGTNFVGAKNSLNEFFSFLKDPNNQNTIYEYLSRDSITWHLIPPRSPHFGGLWESAVKSAKAHIRRVVGNNILTFEELTTIMTQIEAILNSRPLTPLSESPDDLIALTPGHFLIGDSFTSLPEAEILEQKPSRLTRYQHLSHMVQHFWRRWSMEYISSLQQRHKWKRQEQTSLPKAGDMVIVKDDNLPPMKWSLGRIQEVFSGSDNVVRVATVRTARGVIKRSIRKLCPLPLETN